jgi:hypothetical protein
MTGSGATAVTFGKIAGYGFTSNPPHRIYKLRV